MKYKEGTKSKITKKAWVWNATKSLGKSAVNIAESIVPNTASVVGTIKDAVIDTKSAMNETKKGGTLNTSFNKIVKGYAVDPFQKALKDLRTGKFHHDAFGFDMDDEFDIDFGDDTGEIFDDDEIDTRTDYDEDFEKDVELAKTSTKLTLRGLESSTFTIAESNMLGADYLGRVSKATNNMQMLQRQNIGNTTNMLLSSINDNIGKMMQFQSENISVANRAAMDFYAKSSKTMEEMFTMMKETRDGKSKKYKKEKMTAEDLIDNFSLQSLGDYGKQKIDESAIGMMLPLIQGFLGGGEDGGGGGIKDMLTLGNGVSLLGKMLIPAKTKGRLTGFDEDLKRLAKHGVRTLGKNESFDMLPSILKSLFGVKTESISSGVSLGKYRKDAVAWDGIAKQALTHVIPSYLSQILSALTKEDRKVYDYNSGKFVTMGKLKEESDRKFDDTIASSFRNIGDEMSRNLNFGIDKLVSSIENEEERSAKREELVMEADKNMSKLFEHLTRDQKFDIAKGDYSKIFGKEFESNDVQKMIREELKTMKFKNKMNLEDARVDAVKNINKTILDPDSDYKTAHYSHLYDESEKEFYSPKGFDFAVKGSSKIREGDTKFFNKNHNKYSKLSYSGLMDARKKLVEESRKARRRLEGNPNNQTLKYLSDRIDRDINDIDRFRNVYTQDDKFDYIDEEAASNSIFGEKAGIKIQKGFNTISKFKNKFTYDEARDGRGGEKTLTKLYNKMHGIKPETTDDETVDDDNLEGFGTGPINPKNIAANALSKGRFVGGGSSKELIEGGANDLGLNATRVDGINDTKNMLRNNPMVLGTKPGTKWTGTNNKHLVSARAADPNADNIEIKDPMKANPSILPFDSIKNDISIGWGISKNASDGQLNTNDTSERGHIWSNVKKRLGFDTSSDGETGRKTVISASERFNAMAKTPTQILGDISNTLHTGFETIQTTSSEIYHDLFDDEDGRLMNAIDKSDEEKNQKFWDKIKQYIVGTKDADGNYKDGLVSGVANQVVDAGRYFKHIFTGDKYVDSQGVEHAENKEEAVGSSLKKGVSGAFYSMMNFLSGGGEDTDSEFVKNLKGKFRKEQKIVNDPKPENEKALTTNLLKEGAEATAKEAESVSAGLPQGGDSGSEPPPKEKEEQQKKINSGFVSTFKKFLPKAALGATTGIIASMLSGGSLGMAGLFLPTSLVGAGILGAGVGILSKMDKFKDWFLGAKDENGERSGGLISKELQTKMKSMTPKLITGAVGGSVIGTILMKMLSTAPIVGGPMGFMGSMLLPGGLIGGALLGMGASIVTQTDTFKKFLFGKKGEDGDKEAKTKIGQSFKKISEALGGKKGIFRGLAGAGIGAATAIGLSQMGVLPAALAVGGPIGGALAGLAIGISSNTDRFKNWFFGKEDPDDNNKRKGGILGQFTTYMKMSILDPIKLKFEDLGGKFAIWFRKDIIRPLRLSMGAFFKPLTDGVKSTLEKITDGVTTAVNKVVGFVGKTIKKTLDIVTSPFRFIGKMFLKAMGGIISSPFKLLQAVTSPFATANRRRSEGKWRDTVNTDIEGMEGYVKDPQSLIDRGKNARLKGQYYREHREDMANFVINDFGGKGTKGGDSMYEFYGGKQEILGMKREHEDDIGRKKALSKLQNKVAGTVNYDQYFDPSRLNDDKFKKFQKQFAKHGIAIDDKEDLRNWTFDRDKYTAKHAPKNLLTDGSGNDNDTADKIIRADDERGKTYITIGTNMQSILASIANALGVKSYMHINPNSGKFEKTQLHDEDESATNDGTPHTTLPLLGPAPEKSSNNKTKFSKKNFDNLHQDTLKSMEDVFTSALKKDSQDDYNEEEKQKAKDKAYENAEQRKEDEEAARKAEIEEKARIKAENEAADKESLAEGSYKNQRNKKHKLSLTDIFDIPDKVRGAVDTAKEKGSNFINGILNFFTGSTLGKGLLIGGGALLLNGLFPNLIPTLAGAIGTVITKVLPSILSTAGNLVKNVASTTISGLKDFVTGGTSGRQLQKVDEDGNVVGDSVNISNEGAVHSLANFAAVKGGKALKVAGRSVGNLAKSAQVGVEAAAKIAARTAATSVDDVAKVAAKSGVVQKFIDIIGKLFIKLGDNKAIAKQLPKAKTIFGKVANSVTAHLAKHSPEYAGKIAAKMSTIASAAVGIGFAIEIGSAVWNFATGLTDSEVRNLFHLPADAKVDGKMRVISCAMKTLLGLGPVALLDIAFEILEAAVGMDVKFWIAKSLYTLSLDSDTAEANKIRLDEYNAKFEAEFEKYNKELEAAGYQTISRSAYNDKMNKSTWQTFSDWITGKSKKEKKIAKEVAEANGKGVNESPLATVNGNSSSFIGGGSLENSKQYKDHLAKQKTDAIGYGQFSQYDPRWANMAIGKFDNGQVSTMGSGGCGPVALANAAKDVLGYGNGKSVKSDPARIAQMAKENGYFTQGGSSAALFDEGAEKVGLKSKKFLGADTRKELASGKTVVISGKGPNNGPYTSKGHLITAKAADPEAKNVIVQDPRYNQPQIMRYGKIASGAKQGWSMSKNVGHGAGAAKLQEGSNLGKKIDIPSDKLADGYTAAATLGNSSGLAPRDAFNYGFPNAYSSVDADMAYPKDSSTPLPVSQLFDYITSGDRNTIKMTKDKAELLALSILFSKMTGTKISPDTLLAHTKKNDILEIARQANEDLGLTGGDIFSASTPMYKYLTGAYDGHPMLIQGNFTGMDQTEAELINAKPAVGGVASYKYANPWFTITDGAVKTAKKNGEHQPMSLRGFNPNQLLNRVYNTPEDITKNLGKFSFQTMSADKFGMALDSDGDKIYGTNILGGVKVGMMDEANPYRSFEYRKEMMRRSIDKDYNTSNPFLGFAEDSETEANMLSKQQNIMAKYFNAENRNKLSKTEDSDLSDEEKATGGITFMEKLSKLFSGIAEIGSNVIESVLTGNEYKSISETRAAAEESVVEDESVGSGTYNTHRILNPPKTNRTQLAGFGYTNDQGLFVPEKGEYGTPSAYEIDGNTPAQPGSAPFYSQIDPRWASVGSNWSYWANGKNPSKSGMYSYGCVHTSNAMALAKITGRDVNPAAYYYGLPGGKATQYSLTSDPTNATTALGQQEPELLWSPEMSTLKAYAAAGYPITLFGYHGKTSAFGSNTGSKHAILADGLTEDGNLRILDPRVSSFVNNTGYFDNASTSKTNVFTHGVADERIKPYLDRALVFKYNNSSISQKELDDQIANDKAKYQQMNVEAGLAKVAASQGGTPLTTATSTTTSNTPSASTAENLRNVDASNGYQVARTSGSSSIYNNSARKADHANNLSIFRKNQEGSTTGIGMFDAISEYSSKMREIQGTAFDNMFGSDAAYKSDHFAKGGGLSVGRGSSSIFNNMINTKNHKQTKSIFESMMDTTDKTNEINSTYNLAGYGIGTATNDLMAKVAELVSNNEEVAMLSDKVTGIELVLNKISSGIETLVEIAATIAEKSGVSIRNSNTNVTNNMNGSNKIHHTITGNNSESDPSSLALYNKHEKIIKQIRS